MKRLDDNCCHRGGFQCFTDVVHKIIKIIKLTNNKIKNYFIPLQISSIHLGPWQESLKTALINYLLRTEQINELELLKQSFSTNYRTKELIGEALKIICDMWQSDVKIFRCSCIDYRLL